MSLCTIGQLVSIHATLAGGDISPIHIAPTSVVSIHATLAGGDCTRCCSGGWSSRRFYPRHPRGWRRLRHGVADLGKVVSIHATLAGGDRCCIITTTQTSVSIHATLAGGDGFTPASNLWPNYVSIHATLAGGDPASPGTSMCCRCVSIHATLAGGDA